MSILLGIPDAKVRKDVETSAMSNKIGGRPDWYCVAETVEAPVCGHCSHPLSLVVQLYCPLHLSKYHRTLYVFACPQKSCWNKTESWVVYRCQQLEQLEETRPPCPTSSTDDWGVDADSWGDEAEDWADADDDWGSDTGDCLTEQQLSETTAGAMKDNGAGVKTEDMNPNHTWPQEGEGSATPTPPCVDELQVGELCLADCGDDEPGPDLPLKHVVAEDMIQISPESRAQRMRSLTTDAACGGDGVSLLESFHLNVIEEPQEGWEDEGHVTRLLKQYQRIEGIDLRHMLEHSSSGGDGGGAMSEGYEKMTLPHRDITFHKFCKRLAICPQQCIRYCWSGTPLYIRPPASPPTRCQHCNAGLVFELQLTPTLVNFLTKPGSTAPAVEFGTALVFTCKESCWVDSENWRRETIIVQADPDQHLFA